MACMPLVVVEDKVTGDREVYLISFFSFLKELFKDEVLIELSMP